MRKAKIFSLFLSIILLCSTFGAGISASAAFTPKFAIHSEAVYMVNLDTDIVIVSKNPDAKMIPASTTKIMTALVALENIKDFNQTVKVTYDCTNEFFEGNPNYGGTSGASNAEIENGQTNVLGLPVFAYGSLRLRVREPACAEHCREYPSLC